MLSYFKRLKEVRKLLHRAERADSQGEMDPAKLPEQIGKRQALKAKLEAARHQLRHATDRVAAEVAEYEKKKEVGKE